MSILRRFEARCVVLIERLESVRVGLWGWLFSFSAIVVLRNFFEGLSQRALNILDADNAMFFAHAWGFYFVAFVGIILILRFMTGEDIRRVSAFVLFLTPIILLPPALDFFATSGAGGVMAYVQPATSLDSWSNVLRAFSDFSFWGPFGLFFAPAGEVADGLVNRMNPHTLKGVGMNFGIRIEVMLLFIILIWYVHLKARSAGRVLVTLAALYAGLFVLSAFPYLITETLGMSVYALFTGAQAVNPAFRGVNTVLFGCFFALAVLLMLLWSWAHDRRKFSAAWKNVRFGRLLIGNFGMLTAGLLVGISASPVPFAPNVFDKLLIVFAYASVFFGWIWAVTRNDLADERGDRVSESRRPLPTGALSRDDMREMSRVAFILSFVAALLVGFRFFLLRLVWASLAHLYSEPPFRLKRLPLIPNFVLAGAYLMTLVAGYMLIAGNSVFDPPAGMVLMVLVALPLLMEFKNIKDYEGDRVDGIATIPVLFGLERGKRIIAVLGALAFLLLPFAYPARAAQLFAGGAALALWYVYAVIARPYREWRVFVALAAGVIVVAWLGMSGA